MQDTHLRVVSAEDNYEVYRLFLYRDLLKSAEVYEKLRAHLSHEAGHFALFGLGVDLFAMHPIKAKSKMKK